MMRTTAVLSLCLAVGLLSCKQEPASENKNAKSVDPAAAKPDPEAAKRKADEAKKKADEAAKENERREKIAKRLQEVRQEAEESNKRWTDELRKKAAALVAKEFKNSAAALDAILSSPHRTPGNADRDKFRNPAKTLAFFGIEPDMTVVEVGTGGGWYTEVLAPLVANKGKLIAATFDPAGDKGSFLTVYGVRYKLFLASSPELYGKVEPVYVDPPDKLNLGAAGSANMALAFREMHNWHRRGALPKYLEAIHAVLEPGGILGVVQHRAPEGSNPDETANKGYLPEKWLIETVQKAGFELVEKSEINANPKDTKDYEKGVWTLPPAFALKDTDRDKYAAIGESDRMTLKFKKRAP